VTASLYLTLAMMSHHECVPLRDHGLTFPEVKTPAHPDANHGREAFRNPLLSLLADRTSAT